MPMAISFGSQYRNKNQRQLAELTQYANRKSYSVVEHSAAELRQKAREWLARSAVNRIREEPESEHLNGVRFRCFQKAAVGARGYSLSASIDSAKPSRERNI